MKLKSVEWQEDECILTFVKKTRLGLLGPKVKYIGSGITWHTYPEREQCESVTIDLLCGIWSREKFKKPD